MVLRCTEIDIRRYSLTGDISSGERYTIRDSRPECAHKNVRKT